MIGAATMQRIHFNHAGAGLPTTETLQAIIAQLQLEADFGPMEASAMTAEQQASAYKSAARLMNCEPEEVVFGSGHGQLFGDIVSALPLKAGDKILVSRQEWMGNIACLQNAANLSGATLTVMPVDEDTVVDVEALRASLTSEIRLVVLTWIGASGALINPAAAIGRAIRESGSSALYLIDASQAVGQIPVDVKELNCDALVACGRKYLRGPRGTALAYISPRLARDAVPRKIDNFSTAWDAQLRVPLQTTKTFEIGEVSVALKLGLASAIDQALAVGIVETREALDRAASILRDKLDAIPGVRVLDLGREKSACVTFVMDGVACATVKASLAERGISIGMNGREYTPYDLDLRGISELLRASLHLTTSSEDIDNLAQAVAAISSSQPTLK